MLKANLALLTLQQQNLNVISEVTQLDRDLAADEVTILTEHVAQFREYLQKRRQSDAETTKQAALEALNDAPSAIAKLQQTISRLAAEQARLVIREADLDREGERIKRVTDEVQRDYERIQQIAELGGNTAQVSTLLQKRLVFAPSPKALAQQSIEYQGQLSDAALRQLELDELLRDNRDKNSRVAELLAANGVAGEETRDEQRQAAAEAVARHREIVLDLWKTYTRYIGKLSTVEAATRQLLSDTRKYRVFIDDRLLWMPSTEIAPLNEAALLLDGVRWFIDPDHLSVLLSDSLDVLTNSGTSVGFWVIGLIVLVALRKRARHGLSTAAAATQRVRTDSFAATLRAIAGTLVLILPLPWLFIGAGLLLSNQPTVQEYTAVMAVGLQSVGQVLFFLGTLRNLCRTDGLARSHLLWNRTLCDNLGRQAIWLTPLAAPLAFLAIAGAAAVPSAFIRTAASLVPSEQPGVLSLGRLSAIALMVLLAVAVYRIWRKNGPVMLAMAKVPDNAKWANYHILWFGPAILLPLLGLALAALSGYYYTVAFLNGKAGETLWFLIILVLLKDLLLRGLYVTQRRLRFEEAVRYREEQITQRAASAEPAASPESGELPLEEDKINYGQLGDQVRKLVQIGYTIGLLVGLWWIWKDVIPAFSFLDKVELPFSTNKLIDGVSKEVPLTLSDMVAGLLLGGLALFAARNIPALLELTLLQRLPLSRASRYAFTTLTQYMVALAGLLITFNALGLQWSNVQWLVAALSVGLGFGLQEIVANFISGIILLFEQPIRVGDVVTVDNITGTVSRIRIRATTIVNWERQELIIPNKQFITGQLINWTLSDTVNRLTINVGVGYDSDTKQAMEIIAQVAADHPKVLKDPAPRISFEGFGDNSLNLVLRAYLNEIDSRLSTITELHQAILDRFRAVGIEIAFPQRDVHLDTSRPLELVLRRDAQTQAGES
ncbi:MAG: mechanosensitive ion channel [Chromatiaceae bacterium]|nr:mechanosensitive ion channel [Chromatiaceae bacterium]